jgi:nucleoside-diphosphate-sugar epimerase
MRVMVTGATGFTGGHLARTLKGRGYEVRALVREPARALELERDGIELCAGDLRDPEAVRRAAERCDVIYHIAAVYREAKHPDDYYREINVGGTRNVLDAADREHVGRVVHCSTVGVHGDVAQIPADENATYSPGDIYQRSKLEGELLARQRIDNGLSGVIFRPQGIYGPGDRRFLKLFKSIFNGTFRMIGSGDVRYHMTYVSDLVAGIILCGEHPNALGQTYVLGGPRYTSIAELVETLARVVGKPVARGHIPVRPVMAAATVCEWLCKPFGIEPPLYPRRLDFFTKDRAFSTAKARRELGYEPRVDLEEGLRLTFEWYRSAGWL